MEDPRTLVDVREAAYILNFVHCGIEKTIEHDKRVSAAIEIYL
jgi:hypothetical protein